MKKLGFSLLALACVGCAYVPYAREAKKKPREGGVIALRTDHRPEDRQKADTLMAMNCAGANVKVLEEGEVVVGERSSSSSQKTNDTAHGGGWNLGSGFRLGGSNQPSENTNTTTETTQVKEWQISYVCEKAKK